MKRMIAYFKDQRGEETLEWIVVGALTVAVGIAVYTGALQGELVTPWTRSAGRSRVWPS